MTRLYHTVVTSTMEGERLDSFLGSLSVCKSRSFGVKLIEDGKVTLGGEVITSKKHLVHEDDLVTFELPDDVRTEGILPPERIPLDIRYEDDYLLVLSKQRGLICHPAPGHPDHTLANALVAHCGEDHVGLMQGEDRPGIVHRLDMDTTGLMLAAKDDVTQQALQDAIAVKEVDRRYITLVHGCIGPDTGMIDAPIARNTRERFKMCVSDDLSARPSMTTFTVLERFESGRRDDGYTLLECKLFTGRTHQIRVHMNYIRHACVGDPLYGTGSPEANLGLDRQFLHSWSLAFEHPRTAETLSFVDSPTWELMDALESLESRSMGTTERGIIIRNALHERSVLEQAGW